MVNINDTITFLTSEVKDTKTQIPTEEGDLIKSIVSSINSLNGRLDQFESKLSLHSRKTDNMISKVNMETSTTKAEYGNIILGALNDQSTQMQYQEDNGGYIGYFFVIG
mmetsp:Transcript_40518/g.46476  ORF Transcript_40518/g.46476 Transcript_40518/m.46476 type:complete len:109 (-) Transcript_40518:11-337(-)